MPLREPFVTSRATIVHRSLLLVVLQGEGLEGYAECVAGEWPGYLAESLEQARAALLGHLLPAAVGRDFPNPQALELALSPLPAGRAARAALEMAFWDLWAKSLGQPLWALLGGVRREVPAGVSLGIRPSVEATVAAVSRCLAEGYRRVKLKIRPGWDVEVVRAIRERFPEIGLSVDANGAYSLDDLPTLMELDRLTLDWMEQPLARGDLSGHATLQARLATPVCLDESITEAADACRALAAGAARMLTVKPGPLGGLGEARRVHDVARAFGVPVWCGGMLETGVGRAHNLHLATLPGFTRPGDLASSSRYWELDIVNEPLEARDGCMAVPGGPGIGVSLNRAALKRFTVRRDAAPL